MTSAPPVLWHFRFSHFNEKARWALDWKGVPHVRRAVAPGPHVEPIMGLSGQRAVPVLEMDGRVIPDSTAIVAALEAAHPAPPLYPAASAARERALALEELFDAELGPHVRRLAFDLLLPNADFCIAMFSEGVEPDPRGFYGSAFPMIESVMRAEMGIDDAGVAESRAVLDGLLDRIAAERGTRDYLVGDAFSVADLTAASLLMPLVAPPEVQYAAPEPWPDAVLRTRAALERHPSFQWVGEMYRRHRGRSAALSG